MKKGKIDILNCGTGHTEIQVDGSNPIELARAERIITDMLRRGYVLFITGEGNELTRVERFDPKAKAYIIADLGEPPEAEPYDITGEQIDFMLANGTFSKRPKVDGTFTWGKKNRFAIHRSGIPVDLFATTEDNWHVSLVIRTGGKETNLALTNAALKKGMHLNAYGSGFTLQNKQPLQAHSEREVFEIAGVPYAEPEDRK